MTLQVEELTARGRGGISILSLRGAEARARVERLAGRELPACGVLATRLRAGTEWLDEALVVSRQDGSFELHLHGSPAVVARVRAELGSPSVAPGNAEERATALLASVPTEEGARILLDQAGGALRREVQRLALADPPAARAGVARLLERGRRAAPLLRPLRVVLAGPANAGKSTLFNALVGEERAVVSDEEGTTRDALEARVQLGPWAVDLADTAGERQTRDDALGELEREGQALGRRRRAAADLVIWLHPADGAAPRPREAGPDRETGSAAPPRVVLDSRADLVPAAQRERLAAPLRVLEDPFGARALVASALTRGLGLQPCRWRPGEGLPFDEISRAGLHDWLLDWPADASTQGRQLRLGGWLGRARLAACRAPE